MKVLSFKVEEDLDDCAFPNGVVIVDPTGGWDKNTIDFAYFSSTYTDTKGNRKGKTVRVLYVTPPKESKSVNTYVIRVCNNVTNHMHGAVKGKANYHRIYEELDEKYKQAQNDSLLGHEHYTIQSLKALVEK